MSQTLKINKPKITVKHRVDDDTIRIYRSGRVTAEISFIGNYKPIVSQKFMNDVKLLFMKTVSR